MPKVPPTLPQGVPKPDLAKPKKGVCFSASATPEFDSTPRSALVTWMEGCTTIVDGPGYGDYALVSLEAET